jgi:hypothetical protein
MSSERDALAAGTIARHFPEARLSDAKVDLGFGGLHIECRVAQVRELGAYRSASLFFRLSGGALGPAPIFASMSGYAETVEAAIVTGGCNWACSFGPLLRAGLAQEEQPDVDRFELTIDGQRCRVFVDGIDRVLATAGEPDVAARTAAARASLGAAPWLTRRVLESGRLPLLPAARPTVLSVFIASGPRGRTVEVKVNGCDWPGMDEVFAGAPAEPEGATTLLRELAIVVPLSEPPPLTRDGVARTLDGLSRELGGQLRDAVRWRGWRNHAGQLEAPLSEIELARVERELGALPQDYRRFLRDVAGAGAGPGYGLLSPAGAAQRQLAGGTFAWRDGESPEQPPAGVLALAHAGCGIMWVLVLRGPGRGEVWSDAISDPCHSCVAICENLGLTDEVFAEGAPTGGRLWLPGSNPA